MSLFCNLLKSVGVPVNPIKTACRSDAIKFERKEPFDYSCDELHPKVNSVVWLNHSRQIEKSSAENFECLQRLFVCLCFSVVTLLGSDIFDKVSLNLPFLLSIPFVSKFVLFEWLIQSVNYKIELSNYGLFLIEVLQIVLY